MLPVMILLSFVLAYPLFMFFMYLIARVIFTPLDKVSGEQHREREMLMHKARRVRKRERQLVQA